MFRTQFCETATLPRSCLHRKTRVGKTIRIIIDAFISFLLETSITLTQLFPFAVNLPATYVVAKSKRKLSVAKQMLSANVPRNAMSLWHDTFFGIGFNNPARKFVAAVSAVYSHASNFRLQRSRAHPSNHPVPFHTRIRCSYVCQTISGTR